MPALSCFHCGSENIILPHIDAPENDAVCTDCGLSFGPRLPGTRAQNLRFTAAIPGSTPYFPRPAFIRGELRTMPSWLRSIIAIRRASSRHSINTKHKALIDIHMPIISPAMRKYPKFVHFKLYGVCNYP